MKKRILTQIVLLILVATMCLLSSCNIEQLRGEQGVQGEKGDTGATGATGNGIASITAEKVDGGTKVIVQYTDPALPNIDIHFLIVLTGLGLASARFANGYIITDFFAKVKSFEKFF